MRILLTTDTIGGVWTFTSELTAGLLAFGHEVALVSLGRMPSPSQQARCDALLREFGSAFRYTALSVPLEWMADNLRSYSAAQDALLPLAEDWMPDIVHANQFCLGVLPLPAIRIVTAHSDVLSWAETCRPQGLEDTPWLRLYCSLVEDGLCGADAVVAPTKWMARALLRGFPMAGAVKVIANGRTLHDHPENGARLLQAITVGRRWDEAKNMAVLDDVQVAMPIVIAGETSMGEADALCEQEVRALLRRSSVYVATSVYEPFGLAPLEAALCGCAIVANDIPSLREVWNDGAIYFNDRDSLRAALSALSSSPSLLSKASARSSRRAALYPASKMVGQYLALYVDLAERQNPSSSAGREAYAGRL